MANFKEKAQLFLMGLLIGLIIAGSFFIFKLDNYFEKLKHKNSTTTYYLYKDKKKQQQAEEDKEFEVSYADHKKRKEREIVEKKKKSVPPVTILDDSITVESDIDTTMTMSLNQDETENIIVEKEELVTTSKTQLINLNAINKQERQSDSLLHKVSGIKDDKNVVKKELIVELWMSPLKIKGYKMSKSKLVVYGLESINELKVYKVDEKFYLKNGALLYELEETFDYKPFKKVSNPEIIKKIN